MLVVQSSKVKKSVSLFSIMVVVYWSLQFLKLKLHQNDSWQFSIPNLKTKSQKIGIILHAS